MCVRGSRDEKVPARLGQCQKTPVDEIVERVGHRQWPARLHGRLGALEHPNDLERIEGVSSRGIVHLRQQRTRKRDAQVLLDDLVQGGGLEAADSYVAA